MEKFKFWSHYLFIMSIDYKMATKVIDYAVNAARGIGSLLGKQDNRPAYAFAGIGSNVAPDPMLYKRDNALPTLDARVTAFYKPIDVQTSHLPPARESLYRML